MIIGTRVIITDKGKKSFNHVGTFVGMNSQNKFKIYLDEPAGKAYLVTFSNMDSFQLIQQNDNQEIMDSYIKERLSFLEQEIEKLKRLI